MERFKGFDKDREMEKLERKRADEALELEMKADIIKALPTETPDTLSFIYTHGAKRPLHGFGPGLKFEVESKADVGPIMQLFVPLEVDMVYFDSHPRESCDVRGAYRGFWPREYRGSAKDIPIRREELYFPFWVKLNGIAQQDIYEVLWAWEMTDGKGQRHIVRIQVVVKHARSAFSRSTGAKNAAAYPVGLPTEYNPLVKGFHGPQIYGEGRWPWAEVCWPRGQMVEFPEFPDYIDMCDVLLDAERGTCEVCGAEDEVIRRVKPVNEPDHSYTRITGCRICATSQEYGVITDVVQDHFTTLRMKGRTEKNEQG